MTDTFPKNFSIKEFANCFGIDPNELPSECHKLINQFNFRYRVLKEKERDQTLLKIFKRVDQKDVNVAGEQRLNDWDKGWNENLQALINNGVEQSLIPKYIRAGLPLRYNGEFIQSADINFEYNWYTVYRQWLATQVLQGFNSIFEFGSGSGHNLPYFARLTDAQQIIGLDWTSASVKIANHLGTTTGLNIMGRPFNFFDPDYNLDVPENSAFITIWALEQTGENYEAFLEFILTKKPALCVNIEPIVEFLDQDNIVDYSAHRCEKARSFLSGYLEALKYLEKEGKADILKIVNPRFGSLMVESYCQIIWRPKRPLI